MSDIIQWVNLPKKTAFESDPDVKTVDRCGEINLDLTFKENNIPIVVEVRVSEASPKNAKYSDDELKRNPNFRQTQGRSELADADRYYIEDAVQLPAAGGNKYKIEARDQNGDTAATKVVETRRRLYFQKFTMDDVDGKVPSKPVSKMIAHCEQYFVYLRNDAADKQCKYFKTLTEHNSYTSLQDVKARYTLHADKQPVGFALVYSDYIADMSEQDFSQRHIPSSSNSMITVSATEIIVFGNYFLWYGLLDADDSAKKWFVDGSLKVTDKRTGIVKILRLGSSDVDIGGSSLRTHGGYNGVKIPRTPDIDKFISGGNGSIEVSMRVNCATAWTIGYSWKPFETDAFQMITCCNRIQFETIDPAVEEYTWNHEIGHRMTMVANGKSGNSREPDPPQYYYKDTALINYGGHRGPHCKNGATYNAKTDDWTGAPLCLMFGADGTATSTTPNDYCPDCKPIVRKVDLLP